MSLLIIQKYFIWLFFYSFLGWIYESIVCSIQEKRLVNRGFLNGPYCPIYGCGALLDIAVLGKVDNVFLLFILGALATCTLEYLTSYFMERIFNARWWDYSDMKFNLNGRICLIGAVVFGLLSVLLVKWLHPLAISLTARLPSRWISIISVILFAAFSLDFIVTCCGLLGFKEKLKALTEYGRLHGFELHEAVNEKYHAIMESFNKQQLRVLKAFPNLKEGLTKLHEKAENLKNLRNR